MSGITNRARRPGKADIGAYWISFSDVMASLLLVFILAVCYSIFQYFSLLETKTRELDAQQVELDVTRNTLEQRETDLGIANDSLLSKEEDLAVLKNRLDIQETELSSSQAALAANQAALATNQEALITNQEKQVLLQAQLEDQQYALDTMQVTLESQRSEMQLQQKRIDDLLGIRTSIIRDLSDALTAANISASVDIKTGDIVLDSTLLFDTGIFVIKDSGQAQLSRLIPIYLSVLMRPEYSDYVAEIIIEGHTDSKGSYESNLELSQNRALSVAKFCLQLNSLSVGQKALLQDILTAKGRSYSSLVLNHDGTENMEQSRRVEIKFRLKDAEMISEMNKILLNQE